MFPFSLRDEDHDNPKDPIMIIKRNCRPSCFPLCLQSVQVHDSAGLLIGSIHQRFRCWTLCGMFDVMNENEEVVYTVYTPCILTSMGSITKQFGNVVKEALTDSEGANPKMKAALLAAVILFDYLFYEN